MARGRVEIVWLVVTGRRRSADLNHSRRRRIAGAAALSERGEIAVIDQLTSEWWFPTDACREAAARCLHLFERGTGCGLLTGAAGCGKTLILKRLAKQAGRLAQRSFLIDLGGLDASEFRWRLCAGLKINPSARESRTQLWTRLTDAVEGGRPGRASVAVLFDHADRADADLLPELRRWLQLADDSGRIVTILSSRSPLAGSLTETVADFCDLRTEVPPLSTTEAAEFLQDWTREEAVDPQSFGINAATILHKMTGGEPRQLARLLRLSALASQAEGGAPLDATALEALQAEFLS
jgi:type II secretory pathway predicted ATPase ExeA